MDDAFEDDYREYIELCKNRKHKLQKKDYIKKSSCLSSNSDKEHDCYRMDNGIPDRRQN